RRGTRPSPGPRLHRLAHRDRARGRHRHLAHQPRARRSRPHDRRHPRRSPRRPDGSRNPDGRTPRSVAKTRKLRLELRSISAERGLGMTISEPPDRGRGVIDLRTDIPHPARIYDYWLGGKDNFAADREAAEAVIAVRPTVVRDI